MRLSWTAARRAAPLLLVVLAAGGCASMSPDTPSAAAATSADGDARAGGSSTLAPIAAAARGELVELAPGNALDARRVLVLDEYRAASGRLCRRVALANTERLRVVCRRAGGHWSATRPLVAANSSAVVVPATAR